MCDATKHHSLQVDLAIGAVDISLRTLRFPHRTPSLHKPLECIRAMIDDIVARI